MTRVATQSVVRCALAVGVLALALLMAPVVHADDAPPATTPPETSPTPTDPAPPPAPVTPTKDPQLIAAGVTIGGTLVGGLTQREAKELVTRRFARSVELVVSKTWKLRVTPEQLGAHAKIGRAVAQASLRREGFPVPLTVAVDSGVLTRFLSRIARKANRDPVDAQLKLVRLSPSVTPAVPGRRLQEAVARQQLSLALRKHERAPLVLPFAEVEPKVADGDIGKVIVIKRGSNELELFNGTTLKRTFRVATGQSSYPTPIGRYEIVTKQRNPWWYPPTTSDWAQGKEPVPPGPGNPLGTRWMGISSPYVGIHGTPDAASIGYSASHGCIRMLIPQVEWLFERVDVGTPVFIVPA